LKKISVLIVEDEMFVAQVLQDALLDEGFNICDMVMTGEKAVKAAIDKTPDIIIMDICIAGEIDGIETARLIRKNSNIPIIFTTGYAEPEIFERLKIFEPTIYLIKPIDLNELVIKINSMVLL
jgi:DNA-binding response OmpR family regulator